MGKRRGLTAAATVARIAGAGILMPGVDMRDLIKEMQAELDQLALKASSKTPPKHFTLHCGDRPGYWHRGTPRCLLGSVRSRDLAAHASNGTEKSSDAGVRDTL